jgi:hypothetical protein
MKRLFDSEPDAVSPDLDLRGLCETRVRDLRRALVDLDDGAPTERRLDLEVALDAIEGLLTGALERIPAVVAAQLGAWIAHSRYLGSQTIHDDRVDRPAAPPPSAWTPR